MIRDLSIWFRNLSFAMSGGSLLLHGRYPLIAAGAVLALMLGIALWVGSLVLKKEAKKP